MITCATTSSPPLLDHMRSFDTTVGTVAVQSFGYKNDLLLPPETADGKDVARGRRLPNTSMFRRDDWERLGGYDESLRIGFEDWEWWARLLLATGGVARRVEGPQYMYRVSTEGRNHTNFHGIEALKVTHAAMAKNNPGHEAVIIEGLLEGMDLAYFLGQNQSPITEAATQQARYWAQRYGKLEGARNRLSSLIRRRS